MLPINRLPMINVMHGGGYDSAMMLYALHLAKVAKIRVIHVDYGHLAAEAERQAIKKQIAYLPDMDISFVSISMKFEDKYTNNNQLFTGKHTDLYELYNRNGELLISAIKQLRVDRGSPFMFGSVSVPPNKTDMRDCTREYFDSLESFIQDKFNRTINITTPFLATSREQYDTVLDEVLQDAYLNDKYQYMKHAMTCWTPVPWIEEGRVVWHHCGICEHCKKRNKYLNRNGISLDESE